ncbi:hypothetical protein OOZ19_25520 [Saccharopolyspora sp. NFXS83]|uniref:hypothetical protein n=1 Tax=Saccharopolyspora sp. NFXS83 TaxID=2993560 RepID=UPI00224B053A|nr:hypothetical protein [Saccharopolyspora sp. NFXS83]MCX2733616.1 hypothetical protein [Saccharopolyspora sp. NFXS83]
MAAAPRPDRRRAAATSLPADSPVGVIRTNSAVFARQPYAAHTGRDTFDDGDTIFEDTMLLKVVPDGDGHLASTVLSADSDQDGA